MAPVILDQLSQLFFLSLPNVAPLAAVREDFNAFGDVDSRLWWPTGAHLADSLPVSLDEIIGRLLGPSTDTARKVGILTISVWIAFDYNFLLFVGAFMRCIIPLRSIHLGGALRKVCF